MPQVAKSKYYVFTVNNPTAQELAQLRSHCQQENGKVTYLCFGLEVGEAGTPHAQGYIELRNRSRITGVKKVAGLQRSHLETRRGSQDEAIEYCRKDGQFEEYGKKSVSAQGKRTDLDDIRVLIKDGASELDVADGHWSQWVVYRRSFEAYRKLITPPKMRRGLRVYVIQGIAGVGKSGYIYNRFPGVFSVPDPSLKWFDGYNGESVVLIDDYRGGGDPAMLLRLLDIYPLQVPVKGGFVPWNPTTIFITSNLSSTQWHEAEASYEAALSRRIHWEERIEQAIDLSQPQEEMDLLMPVGE